MQASLVTYSFCLYKVTALPDMYDRDTIRTTMLKLAECALSHLSFKEI